MHHERNNSHGDFKELPKSSSGVIFILVEPIEVIDGDGHEGLPAKGVEEAEGGCEIHELAFQWLMLLAIKIDHSNLKAYKIHGHYA